MCYCGCAAEDRSGECTLSKNFLCDEELDETLKDQPDEPEDEREPTEHETSEAEDRYFNK